MSAKHTPGPWSIDADEIRAVYPNHAPGISIARITCFGAHDVHMAKDANARLISAAPDLLSACHSALALLENPDADGFEADRVERMLRDALRLCVAH